MSINWGDAPAWVAIAISVTTSGYTAIEGRIRERRQRRLDEQASQISERATAAAERRALAMERQAETFERFVRASVQLKPGQMTEGGFMQRDAYKESRLHTTWAVQQMSDLVFALRNTGSRAAIGVSLDRARLPTIVRHVPEDAVVRPGEAAEFIMAGTRRNPLPAEIWVSWEGQEGFVPVPVPGRSATG